MEGKVHNKKTERFGWKSEILSIYFFVLFLSLLIVVILRNLGGLAMDMTRVSFVVGNNIRKKEVIPC